MVLVSAMKPNILLSMVLLSLKSHSIATQNDRELMQEYCLLETFQPTCMNNEVVVIEKALYGRRRVGKCIKDSEAALSSDQRFIGCSADVQGILNAKCSGTKRCEVRIPDATLEKTEPCLPGLKMYLEVSYTCAEVVEADRSCVVSVTSNPLHIAGPSYSATPHPDSGLHCGTRTQPWLLEAPIGQRINISLLDFMKETAASLPSLDFTREAKNIVNCLNDQHSKLAYGYITDKSTASSKMKVPICGGRDGQRLASIYLSNSNVVEIVLTFDDQPRKNAQSSRFLLKIEAVGCTNLVPPEDAWVKREEDKIIIGCYTSRQTWHLRCQDGRWIGVVSNCTQNYLDAMPASIVERTSSFSNFQVVAIVAIGFIGLACCLTIMCCGIICLKRFYAVQGSKQAHQMEYKYVQPETVYRGQTVMTPSGV